MYGILERQFRRYFEEADRRRGNTGATCCFMLESRLDNVVYRMGFGSTRAEARQLVSAQGDHGQRPAGQHPVLPGQDRRRDCRAREVQEAEPGGRSPAAGPAGRHSGLGRSDADKAEGTFKKVPDRDEFAADVKEALIVELYSR